MALTSLPKIDYAAHPAYGGMLEPTEPLGRRALEALQPHIEEMRTVEAQRARQFGYRFGYRDEVGRGLVETGFAALQLPAASIDEVEAHARPAAETVLSRLAEARSAGEPIKYKTALETFSAETYPELWRALETVVREMGMLDLTSAYFGVEAARLRGAGLLVNQPNQDWTSKLFRDLETEAPPTAGFHIDSNGKCFVKAVLYLNDVGPEQGPFGMVPGSHRWNEGADERIYRRAFDKSDLVVRSAKKRRMFLSLPEELRVKAEFGGDMLAGSPEAEALLAQELVAIGPRGQLNLFDPESVHRGGNVRRGERRAILITTGPAW
jgi:hypothetical protein